MRFRKAQEEIVGFVIIVVLLAIVLLIFLAFNIRTEPETRESVDAQQFLTSAMEYTTDCNFNIREHARVKELLSRCRDLDFCLDQRSACEVLNQTLGNLAVEGLQIGPDRPHRGYNINSAYLPYNQTDRRVEIIRLDSGNCTSSKLIGASEIQPASGGTIKTSLEICL